MAWLQSILNLENSTGLELVLVTLGLAIILILVFWIFRKIVGNPARRAARNRIPRLSVTDAAAVDDKRRLVLVRRDNVEHLLMIGGPSDVVIETNVMKTQPPATAPAESANAAKEAVPTPIRKAPETAEPIKSTQREPKPVSEPPASASSSSAPAVAAAGAVAATTTSSLADSIRKPDANEPKLEIAEPQPEKISEPVADPIPSAPVEEPKPEVKAEPAEPALEDLETTISESLDDALADIEIPQEPDNSNDAVASSGSEEPKSDNASMDDEMQRLLDELAEETKEPA